MLKLAWSLLAVALAGTASAAGWRSLRIDASSETAFEQSLAEFAKELSAPRLYAFQEALKDVWSAGIEAAAAEQRDYSAASYFREIDGLTYREVIELLDPSGDVAKDRRRAAVMGSSRPPEGPTVNWGARPAGGWGRSGPASSPGLGN
jgi:hypothetical protein